MYQELLIQETTSAPHIDDSILKKQSHLVYHIPGQHPEGVSNLNNVGLYMVVDVALYLFSFFVPSRAGLSCCLFLFLFCFFLWKDFCDIQRAV